MDLADCQLAEVLSAPLCERSMSASGRGLRRTMGSGSISLRPVVYLAQCNYDRRQDRERLEADLKLLELTGGQGDDAAAYLWRRPSSKTRSR